jgi:hypothetical protein
MDAKINIERARQVTEFAEWKARLKRAKILNQVGMVGLARSNIARLKKTLTN